MNEKGWKLNLYHNLKKMQVFKLKEVEIHKIMKKK
jgi:hypothetical protein